VDSRVTIGDLKPTIDSNLAFIVYEAHAGVNYSLPVHIVKMDTLGNLIAEKELERSPNGRTNLAEDSFGNFYTDIERAFESDIVKIDKELNEILWLTTLPADYLGIDQRYKVLDVEVANNGDVLVSGEASYLHQESGVVCGSFLGRLSSEGELLWFKLLSNVSDENDIDDDSFRKSYLLEIKELPNGNIAGTGATIKFLEAGGVNQELWLLSIDENGCIEGFDCDDDIYVLNTGDSFPTITSTKELAEIDGNIFYPNPVADILHLKMEGNFEYQIFNLQSQIKAIGNNEKEVDISHLPAGIYLLQIKQDDQLFKALKFIKL